MLTWPLYRALLRKTTRPILIGPFRGEVGFEAMYWLPWLRRQLADIPAPCYVITRGGARAWYQTAEHALDLYDLRDPQDVRIENAVQYQRTGEMKQRRVVPFDKAVMDDAAKRLGVGRHYRLHPCWMFQALTPYWEQRMTHRAFAGLVDYTPIGAPALPEGVNLPKQFAVARFYYRATFPPHPVTTAFTKAVLEKMAAKVPVVLLNSGIHADEHMDIAASGNNILTLKNIGLQVTPQTNLAAVSAVLGRASAFVGTYGGLAQLALRMRVPSVSFYMDWGGTMIAHKLLSDTLSIMSGVPFSVVRLTESPLLLSVLPQLEFKSRRSSNGINPDAAAPYKPLDGSGTACV